MPEGVPHFAIGEAARLCRHFPSDLHLLFLQPAAPYTEPPPREKRGGRNRRGAGSVLGGIEGYFCGEKAPTCTNQGLIFFKIGREESLVLRRQGSNCLLEETRSGVSGTAG